LKNPSQTDAIAQVKSQSSSPSTAKKKKKKKPTKQNKTKIPQNPRYSTSPFYREMQV
jgi:hypothetical protein